MSVRGRQSTAAIVVLRWEDMAVVEIATAAIETPFPYVPGLLSFREIPAIAAAWERLAVQPDLLLVDGQGIAHPRRFGLASHLGLITGVPTIGCAKTRFIGVHDEPAREAGYYTDLVDDGRLSGHGGEVIGGVLRTRSGVRPLYISIGHKVSLRTALDLTLECCRGYRLPEPTRQAHLAAGRAARVPIE